MTVKTLIPVMCSSFMWEQNYKEWRAEISSLLFFLMGGEVLDIQIAIPIICVALGAVIGVLTYNRNRDKDVRNDASESAVIRTKLDTISSGIDNIRIDIKANERRLSELTERVIRIDESTKQAHKRLDKMEIKGGNGE
jgi:hypothetical protein